MTTTTDMGRPRKAEPDLSTFAGRIAARLVRLRTKAGLNVDEAIAKIAAHKYAVTRNTIYRWERAEVSIPCDALPAIAAAYGVSVRSVLPSE